MANSCIACGVTEVESLLNLTQQPPSNRFLNSPDQFTDRHPLVFGQCAICNHMQLIEPMPPEMVRSKFDWITYNEPEGHLDDFVDFLASRLTASKDPKDIRILGLT